jgi:hypothetical protein
LGSNTAYYGGEMQTPNTTNRIAVIVAIITSLGVIIAAFITRNSTIQVNIGAVTIEALVGQVTQGAATERSLQSTLSAPTSTLPPTDTPEPALPTFTPTASLTPTSTATPDPTFFQDDFEMGVKPEWVTTYGNVGMSQGQLTILSPFENKQSNHLVVVDSIDYNNARVETNLAKLEGGFNCSDCVYTAEAAVLIRYVENGQGVGLRISPGPNSVVFAYFDEKGNWTNINATMVSGETNGFNFNNGDNKIRVEASGNNYFAYINDRLVVSAALEGPSSGKVGLWLRNNGIRGDIPWYAPRFDDFTSQSLP